MMMLLFIFVSWSGWWSYTSHPQPATSITWPWHQEYLWGGELQS